MKYLSSLRDNPDFFKNKKVLLRADFNVPVDGGKISDTYRIDKTLPSINFLLSAGAHVVLISHTESSPSLKPVADHLSKKFPLRFMDDYFPVCQMGEYPAGEVTLFENLRRYPQEAANDMEFAKLLSSLADFYVNDAFSVSHRKHSSIVGVPEFLPSCAGFLFEEEVAGLSAALSPEKPLLFVLGGAKFETKLPLLRKFAERADYVFVGGALANDFFKAQGFETGRSLVSGLDLDLSDITSPPLKLPKDVVVIDENGETKTVMADEVGQNDEIVDIGLLSSQELADLLSRAKTVVWNGPLGNYEKGFSAGTKSIADAIISTQSVKAVVGGGDTVAAIGAGVHTLGDRIFVSTAGGAMLDYLLNETLPGIEALDKNPL